MKHIVLIDRTLVTTCLAPGKCIKEHINNWLKSHVPPTILTNIVKAVLLTSSSLVPGILLQEVFTSKVLTTDLKKLHLLDIVAVSILKQENTIRKWISKALKAKSISYSITQAAVKAEKALLNLILPKLISQKIS